VAFFITSAVVLSWSEYFFHTDVDVVDGTIFCLCPETPALVHATILFQKEFFQNPDRNISKILYFTVRNLSIVLCKPVATCNFIKNISTI